MSNKHPSKPKLKLLNELIMFSLTSSYYKRNALERRSTLLKYLNQPTLAVIMLVTFALLPTVGGNESRKSSLSGSAMGDTVVRRKDQTPCPGATASVSPERSRILTASPFIATMIESFRKALNDPALIDYAN